MRNHYKWIIFLIVPCVLVTSRPMHNQNDTTDEHVDVVYNSNNDNIPKSEDSSQLQNKQVISVRITSSVAVDRGNGKSPIKTPENNSDRLINVPINITPVVDITNLTKVTIKNVVNDEEVVTDASLDLAGANIAYIEQLNAKKEARGVHNLEQIHPFQLNIRNQYPNETDDSIAESSLKTVEIADNSDKNHDNIDNIPLARSVPLSPSSKNYIQGLMHKPLSERGNNQRLTTVSFNIVHDTPKLTSNYNEPSNTYVNPRQTFTNLQKFYNEPPKVYSQPAEIYSEPAKFYSEPSKIYSEPAKIYSEPAKVYSEPAKIYSEPAKFYSQPATLHLTPDISSNPASWQHRTESTAVSNPIGNTTPLSTIAYSSIISNKPNEDHQPEKNYEIDEKVSVQTDGRSHGVQESNKENCKQENCKVGYVVEGRQYRKYRVEERTSDGFIVGEYGVVRNEDGALRGVRYTADSDASPRLIYDALMKFLQLR